MKISKTVTYISVLLVVAVTSCATGAILSVTLVIRYFDPDLLKVAQAGKIIKENYVYEVKPDKLYDGSISGMLTSLDPYSCYYTQSEYKKFNESVEGKFGGIGIEIAIDQDDKFPKVVTPLEDTPASKAGLLPGDKIISVDGVPAKGMMLEQVVDMIRGKVGTNVMLRIIRGNHPSFDCKLTRSIIQVQNVRYKVLESEGKNFGYVRITSFVANTIELFDKAIQHLQEKDIKGIIVDLRFNGGGLLWVCVELADRFLDNGIIVKTAGRKNSDTVTYTARTSDTLPAYPLVVLINEGSASASEVFAGAVKDHKRGTLIGTRTFGKGSVQTPFPFKDGTAIKLTTATYFTPSGKCIDKIINRKRGISDYGVEPDVTVELTPEEQIQLLRHLSASQPDNFVDKQLTKAIEILSSRAR
jgi:carboxyl-terminal processing protease